MNLQCINNKRYILDTLYGVIYFPEYIWEILFTPEMQRLRELRLYNINSLYFTGGANINRYEHSLGTCYLSFQCINANLSHLKPKDKMLISLAALFHDLYNAAFGHSVEYIEDFSPENLFQYKVIGKDYSSFRYKHSDFEPIYFGMCEEISSKLRNDLKLSIDDINKISQYINGKGEYGPLISGSIDLDNIDNIFRMSYHMGLTKDTISPVNIAKSLWAVKGELYIKEDAIHLIKDWIHLREKLYKYLLLNPDEFSAKFMLTEAIELSNEINQKVYTWYDTDFQILEKLAKSSSDVSNIISRMMRGCLYGCFGLFRTSKTEKLIELTNISIRRKIENEINELFKPEATISVSNFTENEENLIKGIRGIYYDKANSLLKMTLRANKDSIENLANKELLRFKSSINKMYFEIQEKITKFKLKSPKFGIHVISDINKINRKVILKTVNDGPLTIGESSKNLYIGVFIKNIEFINFNYENNSILPHKIVQNIKHEIQKYLMNYLCDHDLDDLKLYSEVMNEK